MVMTNATPFPHDPLSSHTDQLVRTSGPPPEQTGAALVLVHGRGGTAESMLSLYAHLGLPRLAALVPQAAGHTWYPQSFLAPLEANQPFLDSALQTLELLVTDLLSRGLDADRLALLGFSQGACLTLEFVARHPRRYGGIMGLTGGLIGPPGTPRDYPGTLESTPVFLGTSDPDPHVPLARVEETAAVLRRMGAQVELRRYPGLPHTINDDELDACRALLTHRLASQGDKP